MAYTPTEWKCGDIVTAEKLNAMERGVADMNAEYVPTEWACGDTITAEKLNHIEQGIANGCGGSSDFSTAEVTVTGGNSTLALPTCASDMGMEGIILSNLGAGSSATVPLWKGHLYCVNASVATVSGDAELIYGGAVDIYGDCTITLS